MQREVPHTAKSEFFSFRSPISRFQFHKFFLQCVNLFKRLMVKLISNTVLVPIAVPISQLIGKPGNWKQHCQTAGSLTSVLPRQIKGWSSQKKKLRSCHHKLFIFSISQITFHITFLHVHLLFFSDHKAWCKDCRHWGRGHQVNTYLRRASKIDRQLRILNPKIERLLRICLSKMK